MFGRKKSPECKTCAGSGVESLTQRMSDKHGSPYTIIVGKLTCRFCNGRGTNG